MTNKKLSNEELRQIYESDSYVDGYHKEAGERLERVVQHIQLKNTDQVVDFACGNGLLANVIANKVKSYIGVDFSEKFIQEAKKRAKKNGLKNIKFACSDIIEFCKSNKDFDKAFSMDFSEHIYDEDFLKIFKAIQSSLKKDGKLIIHTPNKDYFLEILKDKGILKQVEGHIAVRNNQEYVKLLSEIGFKNVKTRFLNHYISILKPIHLLSYLPFVGKYFKARLLVIAEA